jgi:hypothetical protein
MSEQERALVEAESELPTAKGRYGGISLEGDEYVIFDRQAPETWVQSDATVEVER